VHAIVLQFRPDFLGPTWLERNDMSRVHRLFQLAGHGLEIVGATSFPELVGSIFRSLPAISELDAVTLSLIDEDADIHTVMEKLGVDFADFPDLVFADKGRRRVLEAIVHPPVQPRRGPHRGG